MSQQKPAFYYELCRLCLEAEGIYDIFETEHLLQDIYACTGVIVFVSDKLPHKICTKCADFLKNAKEYRVFVKQNDAHLRSMFTGDPEPDIIKTIACHTANVISEPKNTDEEVKSTYFENGVKEDQIGTEPNTQTNSTTDSFLEKSPVVVSTISLRKDLFNSSSSSSCPDSSSPPKPESKEEDPYELLEDKVKIEHVCKRKKVNSDDGDETVDYVCDICSKTFLTYKKFYLHQRLHNKTIVCPLMPCGKKFATKGDLEKHVRTHTGEKPFVCEFCKRGFTQRVSLRYHVRTIHPKDSEESESDSTL